MAEAWMPACSATARIVVASKPRCTSSSRVASRARVLMLASGGRPGRRLGSCMGGSYLRQGNVGHGVLELCWVSTQAKGEPMRAAVLRGGKVESRVVDDPAPGPGQILVRSLACGICASDLHFMDHPEAGVDDDSGMSTYDVDVDIVMGHEYCAEVVDYGPGTERRFPVGARVSSLPVLSVGGGRKIIGQNPESPGGFGEYFLLTEAITRPVAGDLPNELVCIADAISVGWSAASRAQVAPTEVPIVIGCGAIALATIATLKRLGAGPIVAVDFVASRR